MLCCPLGTRFESVSYQVFGLIRDLIVSVPPFMEALAYKVSFLPNIVSMSEEIGCVVTTVFAWFEISTDSPDLTIFTINIYQSPQK
jgi:hypothetical protein